MTKLSLLLLPGLLCDATVWAHQVNHLSNLADIIIPDLNHASSPDEMVAAVLDVAPPYFAMAGHSMGGWVALEVMKQSPERVLGLGLLNNTALPDNQQKYDSRQAMILMAEKGDYVSIIENLTKLFVYNKAVVPQVKMMLERNISAFINQEKAMLSRKDCVEILDLIECPTLVVHSTNDAVFNLEDAKLLATKIKSATLSVIEHCGHMSPMESPEQVTQLLKSWLKNIGDL